MNRSADPESEETRRGVLVCVGALPATAQRLWRGCAARADLLTVTTGRFDECVLHASSRHPVCLLTTRGGLADPAEFARVTDPADPVFRRVAVVLLVEGPATDPRERTVWDTLSADTPEAEVRAALRSALAAAGQRLDDWETADDFHRRRATLTDDEASVLEAVCAGKLNKQIAAEFQISIRTVEQRRRRVFTKMGVDSAVPLARRVGLVEALERSTLRRDTPRQAPGRGPLRPTRRTTSIDYAGGD